MLKKMHVCIAAVMICAGAFAAGPPVSVTVYTNPTLNPSRNDELTTVYTATSGMRGYNERIVVDSSGRPRMWIAYSSAPTICGVFGAADGSSFKVFDTLAGSATATAGGVYAWDDTTYFTISRSQVSSTGVNKIATFTSDTVRRVYGDVTTGTYYGSGAVNLAAFTKESGYQEWFGRYNQPSVDSMYFMISGSGDLTNWTRYAAVAALSNGLRFVELGGFIWVYVESADDLYRVSTSITAASTSLRGAPLTAYGSTNAIYAYDLGGLKDTLIDLAFHQIIGFLFLEGKCLKFERWRINFGGDSAVQVGSTVTVLDSTIFGSEVSTRCFTHGQPQITVVGTVDQATSYTDTIICSYTRAPDTTNKGLQGIYCRVSYDGGATFQAEQKLVDTSSAHAKRMCWNAAPHIPLKPTGFTLWGMFCDSSTAGSSTDTLNIVKAVFGGSTSTNSSRRRKLLTARAPIDAPPINERNQWMIKE